MSILALGMGEVSGFKSLLRLYQTLLDAALGVAAEYVVTITHRLGFEWIRHKQHWLVLSGATFAGHILLRQEVAHQHGVHALIVVAGGRSVFVGVDFD
jgi:hypothetical protein